VDIKELLEPPTVEPVPGKPLKEWMADVDKRIRRVEKLSWTLLGALPALSFLRACSGH
jgi:hypothetical protein